MFDRSPDAELAFVERSLRGLNDGDQLDGWTVPGAPQDDAGIEDPNVNDWVPRGGLGIKEGAAVATPDTVYLGFGFEGISDAATRSLLMGRAVEYLLR